MLQISYYILFFFLCSMLGWLMEVVTIFVRRGKFVNRGFLIGPYCPIYGTGCVLMTWLIPMYADSIPATFALALILCGTVEYLTSWAMEKIYHARWWDYSGQRFQINGRVCLKNLLAFGVLGVLVVKLLAPYAFGLFGRMPEGLVYGLCIGLVVLFITDVTLSANVLGRIRHTAANLTGDSTETLTHAVREALWEKGILLRRTLHAYPEVKLYNKQLMERLHQHTAELMQKNRARNARLRSELEQLEERFRKQSKEHPDK
ncbi:MAG: hypothetical protein ACI4ME_03620 [Aristaeellaceae bacterium]